MDIGGGGVWESEEQEHNKLFLEVLGREVNG